MPLTRSKTQWTPGTDGIKHTRHSPELWPQLDMWGVMGFIPPHSGTSDATLTLSPPPPFAYSHPQAHWLARDSQTIPMCGRLASQAPQRWESISWKGRWLGVWGWGHYCHGSYVSGHSLWTWIVLCMGWILLLKPPCAQQFPEARLRQVLIPSAWQCLVWPLVAALWSSLGSVRCKNCMWLRARGIYSYSELKCAGDCKRHQIFKT